MLSEEEKKSWLQKTKSLKKNLKTISKNIDNTIACLKHEANKTHEEHHIHSIVSSFAFKRFYLQSFQVIEKFSLY
jgi:predicted metal-dependent HD superfamily phosphohydrolase